MARLWPRCYCWGGGSDNRLLSSWMSTATLASAWACSRPWCAQKSSSPALASSTRTYAWAPHRSQTSSAVSGLVGAIAPDNVAFLSRRASGLCIRLAPVYCPYCSAQHILRRQRSPIRAVYATSETTYGLSVAASVIRTHPSRQHTVPASYRYSGAVPVAHRHRVLSSVFIPRLRLLMHSSWSVWDFRLPPRGVRQVAEVERYPSMKALVAMSCLRKEIGRSCPPSPPLP